VSKTYRSGGFLGRGARVTPAVKSVSLNLPKGATLGIVGESGSGILRRPTSAHWPRP